MEGKLMAKLQEDNKKEKEVKVTKPKAKKEKTTKEKVSKPKTAKTPKPRVKRLSEALLASFSNAIIPSFLALVAKPPISVISPLKSDFGGKKTSLSINIAAFKVAGGKLNITAPIVPPITMKKAVICSN